MLLCSVLRGMFAMFGWPSSSISSGVARELRRALQIDDRARELAFAEEAVAAMTPPPRVDRVLPNPLREGVDRFGEPAQIREPPTEPDRVVDARRIAIVVSFRFGEVGLEFVRRSLRRDCAGHGQQQE